MIALCFGSSIDYLHVYLQLNLVDNTDKLSKGTLQRPKHVNSGDQMKGSGTDPQHDEAGIVESSVF
jgi:hypothetical protein